MATKKLSPLASAIANLYRALESAHQSEVDGARKASETRTAAVNLVLDAARAANALAADVKESVQKVFDESVSRGFLLEKSGKDYMRGVAFALDHGVAWSPSLHGAEHQVKALETAGRQIPKRLAEAAAKLAEKRDAKTGARPTVVTRDGMKGHAAKLLAEARKLEAHRFAASLLDAIQAEWPDFKEEATK
jgi:hypothetical protein